MNVSVPRKNKYNAKRSSGSDGFNYDSIRERDYGDRLVRGREAGHVRLLLRQVPFVLPGGVKLVLDFVWVDSDGEMHFEDVKSPPTEKKETFRAKKRMVEQIYDIQIDVVWGR